MGKIREQTEDSFDDLCEDPEIKRRPQQVNMADDVAKGIEENLITAVEAGTGVGKALDLDTEIPTPNGFVELRNVTEGDLVFAPDGRETEVVKEFDVLRGRDCYEVVFSDGSTVVCDGDHLWTVYDRSARRSENRRAKRREKSGEPRSDHSDEWSTTEVVTTEHIKENLVTNTGHTNFSVKKSDPVQFGGSELPLDPYFLGVWLGDGTSTTAQVDTGDLEVIHEFEDRGFDCVEHPSQGSGESKCFHVRFDKDKQLSRWESQVKGVLRDLDVLGNKHIPICYLFSSEQQRRDLLAGLLDSDGSCRSSNGGVEFYNTNKNLVDSVKSLVSSLGYIASVNKKKSTFDGKNCGLVWTLSFRTNDKVFNLERKNDIIRKHEDSFRPNRNKHRYIKEVKRVESRPVKCLKVAHDSSQFLVGRNFIPTHNSFAYLIPAIHASHESELPVIVSTETKALQYQLIRKDLPFLKDTLFPELNFTGYYGQSNYFCKRRWDESDRSDQNIPVLEKFAEGEYTLEEQFQREYEGSDQPWKVWNDVNRDDTCNTKTCDYASKMNPECEWYETYRNLPNNDVIVVNHHLLIAHFRAGQQVLPEPSALIIDEAHRFPDVVQGFFEERLTNNSVKRLVKRVNRFMNHVRSAVNNSDGLCSKIQRLSNSYHETIDDFFEAPAETLLEKGDDRAGINFPLPDELGAQDIWELVKQIMIKFKEVDSLDGITDQFLASYGYENIKGEMESHYKYWLCVTGQSDLEEDIPYDHAFIEEEDQRSDSGLIQGFESVPMTPAPFLSKVFDANVPFVCTSATMTVGNRFDYFQERSGTEEKDRLQTSIYDSPFPYEENMEVYMPEGMPEFDFKNQREYVKECGSRILPIAKSFGGRGMILSTSYRRVGMMEDYLARKLPSMRILSQSSRAKTDIVDEFTSNDGEDRIIVATTSFWSGVDFQGSQLQWLGITKLPFRAEDKFTKAYKKYLDEVKGENSFSNFLLPEAVIQLTQGVGRLVRSSDDVGVVAIMDNRLWEKGYGKVFIRSLPDATPINNLRDSKFVSDEEAVTS